MAAADMALPADCLLGNTTAEHRASKLELSLQTGIHVGALGCQRNIAASKSPTNRSRPYKNSEVTGADLACCGVQQCDTEERAAQQHFRKLLRILGSV